MVRPRRAPINRFVEWELGRLKYLSQGIEILEVDFDNFINSEDFGLLYYEREIPASFACVRFDFVHSVLEFSYFTEIELRLELLPMNAEGE